MADERPESTAAEARAVTSAVTPAVTLADLAAKKARGEPIVMVTAYDYPGARVAEAAGVDAVLVGDSAAMTVLGYGTTREIAVDELLVLTRAVRRGLTTPLLVGDLPFGTYEASDADARATARRFAAAGCGAVKLEGGGAMADRLRAIVADGIPVIGHLGLLPQQVAGADAYRVHGRTVDEVVALRDDLAALVAAGCGAIVLEAVPAAVAALLVLAVPVPVIGIGAGGATDGQVLVFHDLLGLYEGRAPRFVRRYAELRPAMVDAVARYAADVRRRAFPAAGEQYGLPDTALAEIRRRLDGRSEGETGRL